MKPNNTEIKQKIGEIYYIYGEAFQKEGKLEEAIKAYKNCILLKPNYPEVYNNLGNALKDKIWFMSQMQLFHF